MTLRDAEGGVFALGAESEVEVASPTLLPPHIIGIASKARDACTRKTREIVFKMVRWCLRGCGRSLTGPPHDACWVQVRAWMQVLANIFGEVGARRGSMVAQ